MARGILAVVVAAVMLGPLSALAAERVTVLPLKPGMGVTPELAELVTDALVAAIQQGGTCQVVTWKDVESALRLEKKKAEVSVEVAKRTGEEICTDVSCLNEIAGALGATLAVSGTVSKLGSSYVLAAQLFDQRKAEVVQRFHRTLKAEGDEAVLALATEAARALFPGSGSRSPEARVSTTAPGAPSRPPAAAPAEFAQLEERFERLRASRPRSVEELARNMGGYTAHLRELELGYRKLMLSAEPLWAVTSAVRLAQSWDHLRRIIEETPVPVGLPHEDRAYMQRSMQEQAAPLRSRARELFATAIEDASRLGIDTRDVEAAKAALARLEARPE